MQWEKKDYKKANSFIFAQSQNDNKNVFLNLCLSILYEKTGNSALSLKYFSITKRLKMKELESQNLLKEKDNLTLDEYDSII